MKIYNRFFVLGLLLFVSLTYMVQPSMAKYVYTKNGVAAYTSISGMSYTNLFIVTNTSIAEDGIETSPNLHGLGLGQPDENGEYTLSKNISWDDTDAYGIDSAADKIFVVYNSSDYDLVACFDIILCLGWFNNMTVNCTITEESSGTKLVVAADQSGTNDLYLTRHKESAAEETGVLPVINVEFTGVFGIGDYKAYSTHVDPSVFNSDRNNNGADDMNELSDNEFYNFIVKSGETKTFTFSVEVTGTDISFLTRNCYASMTMTVKKYEITS